MKEIRLKGKKIALAILTLVIWSMVIHLGWNMSMPDMFGLEPVRFKQALGVALLIAALVLPISRLVGNGSHVIQHDKDRSV